MAEKIIGKEIFVVTSSMTEGEGHYDEPKTFTTLKKAQKEMTRQAKEFKKGLDADIDICEKYAIVSDGEENDCSWSIYETILQ